MKFRQFVLLAIILILLFFIALPVTQLRAVDFNSSVVLAQWRVNKNDSFTIRFIHSVMLTPVYEVYRINEELEIILSETIFYSYGAGLPENTIYDFEMIDKGFRIYNINQRLDKLVYRTGATIANHNIIVNNKEIPFLDFSKPQTAVEFQLVSRPLIVYLYEEVLTWTLKMMKL